MNVYTNESLIFVRVACFDKKKYFIAQRKASMKNSLFTAISRYSPSFGSLGNKGTSTFLHPNTQY